MPLKLAPKTGEVLTVPNRDTATLKQITDALLGILLDTKDHIRETHGIKAADQFTKAARQITDEIPPAGRSAHYTGTIGLHEQIVKARRQSYGQLLDLAQLHAPDIPIRELSQSP